MGQKLPVFNFTTQNTSNDTLDVFIDGVIVDAETENILKNYFGDETSISYKSFRNTVEQAKPKVMNVFVNCLGGHVGDGLAMHDYIQDLQSKGTVVNVTVRGWSASAGTYFQMAVPVANRFATQNSFGLIHNVSGGIYGSLREVQSYVNMMEKMNKNIVNLYVNNTKLSHQKVTDMMDAETVLSAEEMLNYGFVGNIINAAPVKNIVDASHFAFKNQAVMNAHKILNNFQTPIQMENKVLDAIKNGFDALLEKLNLKDKANDENVKNAFTEFSTAISNAVKEGGVSDETLKTTVSNAVAEAMKNLADNEVFKNATKNFVTTEQIANMATKEDIKDVVTNQTLGDKLTEIKNEIVDAVGDKLGNGGNKNEKKEENKEEVRKVPKNKYAGVNLWQN